jgi:hypothetical protein
MPRKGGKIIGLAKDEKGKPTKEVPPTDPTAVQWMDTNTYKMLSKEDAVTKHEKVFGQPSSAPSSPVPRLSSSPAVGLGRRRKTRRGKKTRKVTRRR